MLTVGSLFAGIGGLELGLEATGGFRTVWQVENDAYANETLARHWPGVRRWGDVATFPPNADINGLEVKHSEDCKTGDSGTRQSISGGEGWYASVITCGFPCQDISYAGKGAGLGGDRSGLFYEAMRVVRTLGPRYVVLENVAALLTRGLDAVLGTLASLGYSAEWHCIPAAAVGAPHIRDRVFVIAYARCQRMEGRQPAGADNGPGQAPNVAYAADGGQPVCGRASGQGRHAVRGGVQAEGWQQQHPWATEPDVGRVAHGVPNRVDRLRCLGNAVVPQVAYYIGQRILAYEGVRQ